MPRTAVVSKVLVGFDGSVNARRAVAFLTRMKPPRGAEAVVVNVVEPMRIPAMGLLPASVRHRLGAEAAAARVEAQRKAHRVAEAAAKPLAKAGWRPRIEMREGMPVAEILRAARSSNADLVVVGAHGVTGVRFLLGSVSAGVLKQSAVPVLVVK